MDEDLQRPFGFYMIYLMIRNFVYGKKKKKGKKKTVFAS